MSLASGVIVYGGGGAAILTASLVIAMIAATVAIEKRRNLYVWLLGSFAGTFLIMTAVVDLAVR